MKEEKENSNQEKQSSEISGARDSQKKPDGNMTTAETDAVGRKEKIVEKHDRITLERAMDVVAQLKEKGLNPSFANTYPKWLSNLVRSIVDDFGEDGRQIFHSLSQLSKPYQKEKCDEIYTACLKDQSNDKRRQPSRNFFYAFRQIGIVPRLYRLSELKPVEANAYFTAAQVLTTRHKIRMDLFTGTIYFDGRVLDDKAISSSLVYLQCKYGFSKINKDYITSLFESEFVEKFHRIDELMKNYTPVNPTGNIQKIADTLITETASGVKVNWRGAKRPLKDVLIEVYLVKLVEQFYRLVANDFCLVLLGDGYLGKTHWLLNVLPPEISDLVRITQFSDTKDFKHLLCTSALLIIDEIREKDMASNEFMKSTLTTPEFPLRLPYHRTYEMRKRIASLAGTGNNYAILRDPTGNRRFIPLWLDQIDKKLFNSVNKMDLFHEMFNLHKQGYDTQLTDELLEAIADLSKDFEVQTDSDQALLEHCPPWDPKHKYAELLSVSQKRDLIFERTKRTLTITQIGMSVQRLKYEGKTAWNVRYNGKRSRVWKFYCCTDPNITQPRPKSEADIFDDQRTSIIEFDESGTTVTSLD